MCPPCLLAWLAWACISFWQSLQIHSGPVFDRWPVTNKKYERNKAFLQKEVRMSCCDQRKWESMKYVQGTNLFFKGFFVSCRSLSNGLNQDCLDSNLTHILIAKIFEELHRHLFQICRITEIFGDFLMLTNSPFPVWPSVMWSHGACSSSKLGLPWWVRGFDYFSP